MRDQRETRREYRAPELRREDLPADPLVLFQTWLEEAVTAGVVDATAMSLATADSAGAPSVRIVLLKHFDDQGLCWYTDYRSRKGRDLAENPRAACLFYWRELHRQVRVSGAVERLDEPSSSAYFHSRPDDSRFSAAASHQSAVVDSRATLEARVAELRRRHPDGDVPRPGAWGGYRLRPREYEFWQGREHRLHDRFLFSRPDGSGDWQVARLQP
ncbi:MAG: pyridoxamine 5'-phosphate oxidase [Pseudomonadota bacterium]